MTAPRLSILNRAFQYTPAAGTDVTESWRRAGWKPIAEVAAQGREQVFYDPPLPLPLNPQTNLWRVK